MGAPEALLWLLVGLHGVFALGWAVAGQLGGLKPVVVRHWTSYCACVSLGLVCFLVSPHVSNTLIVLGNLSLTLGCVLLRRGLVHLGGHGQHDVENFLCLLAASLGQWWVGPLDELVPARSLLVSGVIALLLLRTSFELGCRLPQLSGSRQGWLLGAPLWLMGLLLVARMVRILWFWGHPGQWQVPATNGASLGLLFAVVLGSSLFQHSLAYLVVQGLVRQLRDWSTRDTLTGLNNRRAWVQALALEDQHLRRRPANTAVLAIDIDHFKRLNDCHGHPAGDAVLVSLARTLQRTLRTTDVLARVGGEEFGVLLRNMDQDGAVQAAERLREAVASMNVVISGQAMQLTISVGVALLPEAHAPNRSVESLLELADAALYRAKSAGRNRVVLSGCATA